MKKWSNPEIAELDFSKTAETVKTCKDGVSPCYAPGNGGGQCNNCRGNNPTGKKDHRIPNNTQVESEEEYNDIDGVS